MICKHCGAEIPEGSRFCIYCGKKLEDSLFVADDQTQIRQPVPTPSSQWTDESPEAQEAAKQIGAVGLGVMQLMKVLSSAKKAADALKGLFGVGKVHRLSDDVQ